MWANMNCCSENKKKKPEENQQATEKKPLKFSWWWCLGLIPIALGVIWIFRIPVTGLLPWAVFLLCPLMHIFMMKGHGEHGEHKEEKK